jgi:hypothetical protein
MVILVLRDPTIRMMQQMEHRAPLAQRFQSYYNRLESTQLRIFRSMSSAGERVRKNLDPIWQATDELVDEAYRFCERMSVLENHRLVSQRGINMKDQLAELDFRIEHAEDPVVRIEFEESRAALQKRYSNMLALSKHLDRAEAHLTGLSSELAQVLTEIIRLQSMEPDQMPAGSDTIRQSLEKERLRLLEFKANIQEP